MLSEARPRCPSSDWVQCLQSDLRCPVRGVCGVHKNCDLSKRGYGFLEHLHCLAEVLQTHAKRRSGDVSSWSREALDKSTANGITRIYHNDRNRLVTFLAPQQRVWEPQRSRQHLVIPIRPLGLEAAQNRALQNDIRLLCSGLLRTHNSHVIAERLADISEWQVSPSN
jgi:hypothetical protein